MAKETYYMAKETYYMAKETYSYGKRDLLALAYGKRDLFIRQKRPIHEPIMIDDVRYA
jgi:hypothetical protein